MTAARFHLSREQLFDASGNPLAGGRLYFYVTGTTTELATYSNAGLTSANSHPVVADSAGRVGDIFLQDQVYRVQLRDAADTLIWDTDNVYKDVTFVRAPALPAAAFPNMLVHNTADGKRYRRNAASTAWIDEGPIDSVGNTAGVTDVVAGTSAGLFVTPDSVAGLWERGTDIASTGTGPNTLALPETGGGYFEVTGTTAIAGINSQRSGLEIELRFQQSLTLTHGASFALLGGANITTEAGDVARFRNVSAVGTSSTTWRMVDYTRASGRALISTSAPTTQASSYTATISDRGGAVVFSGLSADVTLNLPTASSFGAGQILYVRNNDATYGVTIDPSGSETLDGATTRRTNGPNTVVIMSTGTNWVTISGVYRYVSPEVAISAGASFGGTHGLGVMPYVVSAIMVCKTADAGYAVGDRVYIPGFPHGAGNTQTGCTVGVNTTNAFGIISASNTVNLIHKTTGSYNAVTSTTNWRIVVECLAS